jgi:uncharacterized SAM-binding protein YcdF (DUF218 family)
MLSPLTWLLAAFLLACVGFGMRARGRWLTRISIGLAAVAVLAMTPMVGNGLIGWLETQPPMTAPCLSSPPQVAVVLAGGVDTAPTGLADLASLGISSRRRVERAVEWWHERPGRSLVMSGGPQLDAGVSTGALMADYARRLGVAPAALDVEGASTSTWENARALAGLRPSLPRRIALITSAMHMPRARYAMARAGFSVCAIAADKRRIPFGLPGYLIPRSSALDKTEAALHEFVGMAYYRWLDARSRSKD